MPALLMLQLMPNRSATVLNSSSSRDLENTSSRAGWKAVRMNNCLVSGSPKRLELRDEEALVGQQPGHGCDDPRRIGTGDGQDKMVTAIGHHGILLGVEITLVSPAVVPSLPR